MSEFENVNCEVTNFPRSISATLTTKISIWTWASKFECSQQVCVELASDHKDFATTLARTRLAEMTNHRVVPIPQRKAVTELPPAPNRSRSRSRSTSRERGLESSQRFVSWNFLLATAELVGTQRLSLQLAFVPNWVGKSYCHAFQWPVQSSLDTLLFMSNIAHPHFRDFTFQARRWEHRRNRRRWISAVWCTNNPWHRNHLLHPDASLNHSTNQLMITTFPKWVDHKSLEMTCVFMSLAHFVLSSLVRKLCLRCLCGSRKKPKQIRVSNSGHASRTASAIEWRTRHRCRCGSSPRPCCLDMSWSRDCAACVLDKGTCSPLHTLSHFDDFHSNEGTMLFSRASSVLWVFLLKRLSYFAGPDSAHVAVDFGGSRHYAARKTKTPRWPSISTTKAKYRSVLSFAGWRLSGPIYTGRAGANANKSNLLLWMGVFTPDASSIKFTCLCPVWIGPQEKEFERGAPANVFGADMVFGATKSFGVWTMNRAKTHPVPNSPNSHCALQQAVNGTTAVAKLQQKTIWITKITRSRLVWSWRFLLFMLCHIGDSAFWFSIDNWCLCFQMGPMISDQVLSIHFNFPWWVFFFLTSEWWQHNTWYLLLRSTRRSSSLTSSFVQ